MPSFSQWGMGVVVGFLILQAGGMIIPQAGPVARVFLAAIFVVGAMWAGLRVAYRGD